MKRLSEVAKNAPLDSPAGSLCMGKIRTFRTQANLRVRPVDLEMLGGKRVLFFPEILEKKVPSNGYFYTAAIRSMVPYEACTLPLPILPVKYSVFSFISDGSFEDASARPNYKTCCQEQGRQTQIQRQLASAKLSNVLHDSECDAALLRHLGPS